MLAAFGAQMANRGIVLGDSPVPVLSADEVAVATANVAAWGGNVALFTHFLAAGGATGIADQSAHQLAAVAGWRAGVLGLRDEALRQLGELPDRTAAAVLGLGVEEVSGFALRQRVDPYWWPGRAAAWGQVLRAGGFAGLGGRWLAPPVRASFGGVSGQWVVQTADGWWRLDADAFGARFTELPQEPDWGVDTDPAGVRITVRPDSYLVTLAVPAEWNPGGGR